MESVDKISYKIAVTGKAAALIANRLEKVLSEGKKVLWLVPGGSAAAVATEAQSLLAPSRSLTITLTDERYGPVGHKDSNWQQLKTQGFDFNKFVAAPVLRGLTLNETVAAFQGCLEAAVNENFCLVGLFGMGPDGHTSGILPGSDAVAAEGYACGYKGPDYQRITTTPRFISMLDEAFIFAVGENKHTQIVKLEEDLKVAEQPVQIFKTLKQVTFFNDLKGDKL